MTKLRPMHSLIGPVLLILMLGMAGSACRQKDQVRAKLYQHVYPGNALLRLEIQAQVSGPQDGLLYKWFCVSGECDPQESTTPMTKFKFGEGSNRDKVTLEIWRDEKRIAETEIDLTMTQEEMRLAMERESGVKIKITNVPPYDHYGGDTTHADISGIVTGAFPTDCKVIIYARVADNWYIQPTSDASLPLTENGTWSGWTHTGGSYAALLVRTNYEAMQKRNRLPNGDDVLAQIVVEGVKQ